VSCDLCGAVQRSDHLERHQASKLCKIRCDMCHICVVSTLFEEHKETHLIPDLSSQSSSQSATQNPFNVEEMEEELQGIYHTFAKYIKNKCKLGRVMDRHNFQVERFCTSELVYLFKKIFRLQKNAFKINLSMGMILQHKTSGEYRFYWASQNNQLLFEKPTLIRHSGDKVAFISSINGINLLNKILRPNSEWIFVKVTNIEFFVYKLRGIPIGSSINLPQHLLRNKGLYSLVKDRRGKPFVDKKCFFRCLALFQGASINAVENNTKRLLKEFCEKACITNFVGVTMDQLEDISRIFKIAINVYEQSEDRSTDLIFRSTLSDNPMNLNLYSDHFSFIKDMEQYSQCFRCPKCDKLWSHLGHFNRHVKSCEEGVKESYRNGTFRLKPTLFEELEYAGVDIPKELRSFPYRATYDIECMIKSTTHPSSEKVEYSAEHVLVSISVCSNVAGFLEPKCFILEKEGHQRKLVRETLDYLQQISETSAMLMRERYADYLDEIKETPCQQRFDRYTNQMPVLSFNGARYDLKVLKTELIPVLVEMDSIEFVIKKGTGYMVIATEELKFLDVVYYIAPGFSYDKFLKAYGANQTKSYFPYEYLDSLDKLESKLFPEYDSFYSSLKSNNTLEPVSEHELTKHEATLIGYSPTEYVSLRVSERKIIGFARYTNLKTMFESKDWTMRDYLTYYNNLDVQPFLEALEHMSCYYTERGVDVFKDAVSGKFIFVLLSFISFHFSLLFCCL